MFKTKEMRDVGLFTLICFLFSWPIFFAVDAWLVPQLRQDNLAAVRLTMLFGHMLGMLGPALSALVMWRVLRRGTPPAWKWSLPKYYLWTAAAAMVFWCLPGVVGLIFGDRFDLPILPHMWLMIGVMLLLGWVSGLGEEVGWCAYLLPLLSPKLGRARAVVVSGAVRGLWHWPVLIGPLIAQTLAGETTWAKLALMALVFAFQLVLSNILFGAVFGWVWYRTQSMPLLGWMHQWYDLVRDVTILVLVGYVDSLWVNGLNGVVFYMVGYLLLNQIGLHEGARLQTLYRPESQHPEAAS